MKFNLKDNVHYIIILIAVILLAVIVIGLLINATKSNTTKSISVTAYTVGSLNADGSVNTEDDTRQSAYTTFISADGLKVKLEDNAPFKYSVYYFTKDKTLITGATQTGLGEYGVLSVPITAEYARIMVTLNGGARFGVLGMAEYNKYITVTVNK